MKKTTGLRKIEFITRFTQYAAGSVLVKWGNTWVLCTASVSDKVRIKGSGGIRDLDTVLAAREAGASRCGVSATEKIMAEAEKRFAEGKL